MAEPPSREVDTVQLSHRLGHRFRRPELLLEAVTHSSVAVQERGAARFGYERLEFLGDRVLSLVIADWLFDRFPGESEGMLARRHAALVRRETVTEVAGQIGLGRYLILSPGEAEGGGRDNAAILADACEAVIAALYLDGGLKSASRFIRAAWADWVERDARPPVDPKTALQEWAQGRGLPLPCYETVARRGPDHEPEFEISVSVKGSGSASASGTSKRNAEKEAASRLLAALHQSDDGSAGGS